jgi:hypothetical protein
MGFSDYKFQSRLMKIICLTICGFVALVVTMVANGQTKTSKAGVAKFHSEAQQPIYREYRGVRLNMTMEEARAKLGTAVMKSDELDYFIFSANESAQIAFNAAHKVATISVDYTGGIGAPDYMSVVGLSLLERPDGSLYRMVEYDSEGFWVSYNKSAGAVPTVTITMQVVRK